VIIAFRSQQTILPDRSLLQLETILSIKLCEKHFSGFGTIQHHIVNMLKLKNIYQESPAIMDQTKNCCKV